MPTDFDKTRRRHMCRMRYTAERLRPGKALTKDLANIFYHAAKMCTCTDIFAKRSGNTREKMPRRDRQAPENPQPKIFCSYFTANLSKTLRMRQLNCASRVNGVGIYYTASKNACLHRHFCEAVKCRNRAKHGKASAAKGVLGSPSCGYYTSNPS